MKFSVVIPTYNRVESLNRVLFSIKNQDFPKDQFEVVIVNDGGSVETIEAVEKFKSQSGLNIRYFLKDHEGPAAARNFGIERSEGELILFSGDDAIFDKNLLKKHHDMHCSQKNVAVLGFTKWDLSSKVNGFMEYIAPFGTQFHYHTIKNTNNAGWDHFYTINISLPKKMIGDARFDTRFIYAAFEDLDFGLTLAQKGMRVVFEKEAVVYHAHHYEPEIFYDRMIKTGKSSVIFVDKYKCNKTICRNLKWRYMPFDFFPGLLVMFSFLSGIFAHMKFIKKIKPELHWYFNIIYHYSLGVREAERQF